MSKWILNLEHDIKVLRTEVKELRSIVDNNSEWIRDTIESEEAEIAQSDNPLFSRDHFLVATRLLSTKKPKHVHDGGAYLDRVEAKLRELRRIILRVSPVEQEDIYLAWLDGLCDWDLEVKHLPAITFFARELQTSIKKQIKKQKGE